MKQETALLAHFLPTSQKSIIDHKILLQQQLCFLNVDQTLHVWIRAFLTNRTQAMRVGSSLSPWRHTYGGVPQGIKLGIALFAIMINRLLGDLFVIPWCRAINLQVSLVVKVKGRSRHKMTCSCYENFSLNPFLYYVMTRQLRTFLLCFQFQLALKDV